MCPRCHGVIPGEPVFHAYPHLLPICKCHEEIQAEHDRKQRERQKKKNKEAEKKIEDTNERWMCNSR